MFSSARRLSPRGPAGAFALVLAGFTAGYWVAEQRRQAPPAAPAVVDITLENRGGVLFADKPQALPEAPVVSTIDGDTLQIIWNDAPKGLRYYGVNTTERGHPCYAEASRRNRELAGGAVRLAFDARPEDRYNRLLAYVFTADGRSIDALLVSEGLAKAWRRDGRFKDALAGLEDDARLAKRGCLWSGEAPAEKPKRPRKARRKAAA